MTAPCVFSTDFKQVSVKARGTGGTIGARGNSDQIQNWAKGLLLKIKEKDTCIHRKSSPPVLPPAFTDTLFEPTCAFCTVGSYAPLSVRPSVRPYGLDQKSDWTIIHISESIRVRGLKFYHNIESFRCIQEII